MWREAKSKAFAALTAVIWGATCWQETHGTQNCGGTTPSQQSGGL